MEGDCFPVNLSSDRSERKAKKLKPSPSKNVECSDINDVPIHTRLKSFYGFNTTRILSENSGSKTMFVEGTFESDSRTAIVLLEKQPFSRETVNKVLTEETELTQKFHNDIYGRYDGYIRSELNGISATIIHPATEKHVQKYLHHPHFIINETAEMYRDIAMPYQESQSLSLEWVFNILDHKSETERIIFEDPDPITGFVLLPDIKWDEKQLDNLHVIAIVHVRGIRSLRCLTAEHLPLLRNIKKNGLEAISKKYNKSASQLRVYFHYQPSYYHLHVHFSTFESDVPGTQTEKAHLIDMVINNLELMGDYYQRSALTYTVRQNDPLYEKFKEAGNIIV